jgi:hypothetical protein
MGWASVLVLFWVVFFIVVLNTSEGLLQATFVLLSIVLFWVIWFKFFNRVWYRMQRSTNGMPPAEFSTRRPDVTSSLLIGKGEVLVGTQSTVAHAGNLGVDVRVDDNSLQLVERFGARSSMPSYEVPRSEILSVSESGDHVDIHLRKGSTIRMAYYVGVPLSRALSGEVNTSEVERLLQSSSSPVPAGSVTGRRFVRFAIAYGAFSVSIMLSLALAHQLAYATGVGIGLGAMTLLDRYLYRAFRANKTSQTGRTPFGIRIAAIRSVFMGAIIIAVGGLLDADVFIVVASSFGSMCIGLGIMLLFMANQPRRTDS